jgi:hypothetical protein
MAISSRQPAAIWQKKRKADSSDDESTVELSSSKEAKVSAVAITPQPLILKLEPMDLTSTGKPWAAEKTLDTISQILYEVDLDQFGFNLYYSSDKELWKIG